MRRPVIAGNWKMYKTQAEARAYFAALAPLVAGSTHCDIIVAPPFTALTAAVGAARGTAISIAAQDLCWEAEGAFTGQVPLRCWWMSDVAWYSLRIQKCVNSVPRPTRGPARR